MKKLIIGLAALLLLGGGGAAGYMFVYKKDGEAQAAQPEPPPPPAEPTFVEFDPIRLPVVGQNRIEQIVDVIVVLEVRDEAAGDALIQIAPRVYDAIMADLYGELHRDAVRPDGTLDLRAVKRRILAAARDEAGDDVVIDALVQMVSQRPV
ncbi:MAG: hypothetical protein RID91_02245 [Azospirillaceae bacterium]